MQIFLIYLDLCIFCVILLSERSYGADYRYEACVPRNCGDGPNISFPFYIPALQESYCGYPGFVLNCSQLHGFPVLELPQNLEYVVEDIFYQTRSLRVYNAVLSSDGNSCLPRIRNTTLSTTHFDFADNVTSLHLFSNCSNSLSKDLLRVCDDRDRESWYLPLYGKGENFANALKQCESDLVAPVEEHRDDGKFGSVGNVVEVLRRGFVLNWTAADCSECEESGGRCGFNVTSYHFKCFCPDRPHSRSCKPGAEKHQSPVILAAALSGGVVFLLICLLIWKCKKRFKNASLLSRNISFHPSSKSDIEDGSCYYGIPVFSCTELEMATHNFDSSKELGDGGFGTVYYGKLRDGREVAIKRLYENNCQRMEQFMNEIKILTSLRHQNLVSLYGCTSRRSRELLLVYEYIPNGTVADHLHGERANEAPLTWAVRMIIAIETASALAYLHKSDIIHRDVKTSNILLDNNCRVKVADFGLSRFLPGNVTHIWTAPQGTPGYVDPEYNQCYHLTDKSDVYSFGVVLIELISSMPAVDINRHRHEINLANLAVNKIQRRALDELIDSSLGYESDFEVKRMTTCVAELAFRCLQLEKNMRPCMDEIFYSLKAIQGGEMLKIDKENIPYSPETDDIVFLKNKNFESSPIAVTDVWVSSSTTTGSSTG